MFVGRKSYSKRAIHDSSKKKHQIYTLKQNKVALNEDDNEEFKRYICKNKINTLAHGHYKI